MNADYDFQIGKDHQVCQDYSMVGYTEDKAVAILSDGCSASPHVDIGARLLTLSAREMYLTLGDIGYECFGSDVIARAGTIFQTYPHLDYRALDATLLIAMVTGNELRAYIYGDGVFFHKSKAGLYAMKVELSNNTPDYLSYNLTEQRRKDYDAVTAGAVKHLEIHDGLGKGSFEYKPFTPVIVERSVEAGDIVALCSDGIGSFRRSDNTQIPWLDLAEEFIGYKNFTGVFVKRRLTAFKKKCAKEGWTHSDDISVASIVI
jgi:hypothetical protein